MPRKARVKKTIQRELKRATNVKEAQDIISELSAEVEKKVEEFTGKRIPGMTVGGSKVSYQWSDLMDMFPVVSFIPEETIPLTFQGVMVQALAGIEMHVPKCFKDIYDRHVRERRSAAKSIPHLGYETTIALGAGALPPRTEE